MEQEQFKQILKNYNTDNASSEQVAFVEAYYKAFDLRPDVKENPESDGLWQEMNANINSRIDNYMLSDEPGRTRKLRLWPRIAAAAIILAISAGSYFLLHKSQPVPQIARQQVTPIKPGGNMATLTLANGKRIVLNTALNGTLVSQAGIRIKKTADGQLLYSSTGYATDKIEYNTIETPKGGQYRVELEDGTIAWLNAASSLKYQNRFIGKQRIVELQGEGYFEVAKDKSHPFIVKSKNQSIEVLGTHFNVNAYNDETALKTTVLEGSVKVTAKGKFKLLKPGQQSLLTENSFEVSHANLEETIAWKNGYFRFNNEKIESIMRKIARWYNIEVSFEGPVTQEEYNGTISRNHNIKEVLEMLGTTKTVRFTIQGRRVTVKK